MDIIDLHKDKYSTDRFISRCCNMDLVDILDDARRELERLGTINLRSTTYQPYADVITAYRLSVQEIYEFLSGAPAAVLSERNRERIKPLLAHLGITPG